MQRNLRLYRHSSCQNDCSLLFINQSQEQVKLPQVKQNQQLSLIGALQSGSLQLRALKRPDIDKKKHLPKYHFNEVRKRNYKPLLPKIVDIKNRSVALQTTGFSPWLDDTQI